MDFDKAISLLELLKQNFGQDERKLLLTSSFSMSPDFFETNFNFSALSEHLDFVHFLPIDFDVESLENYNASAIRNELNTLSIQEKINGLIDANVPASKLIMGVTFGGIDFYSTNSSQDSPKFLEYGNVCAMITDSNADKWMTYYEDEIDLMNAFYRNDDDNEKRTVLYGDCQMVANQMRFAVKRGLAGAVAVTVDRDDFMGICPLENDTFYDFLTDEGIILNFPEQNETTFPLLRTINEAITVALDELSQQTKGNAVLLLGNIYCICFVFVSIFLVSILSI